MPGRKCPKCGKSTFVIVGFEGHCTSCSFKMHIPANEGKGGKGSRCPVCGKNTFFNGRCSNCGGKER